VTKGQKNHYSNSAKFDGSYRRDVRTKSTRNKFKNTSLHFSLSIK